MSTKMRFEFLPNEIFVECFQYLNAPDIFHSFDQLNYRFHTLIRNNLLCLNFHQCKKPIFDDFCETILSNPEIKQNIISLQLSNRGTCGQIQSFLSCFSLNEFIHLWSLSLIDINDDNAKQILPMLPFLSNLYYFYCNGLSNEILEMIPALSTSKLRILTIPNFNFNATFIYETLLITSLTISLCDITDLCQLFRYIPILKYLKIGCLSDNQNTENRLNFPDTNAVHLKQIIVDDSMLKFQVLKVLLELTPNLKIFSISNPNEMEMIDANCWQHLIEFSLPHLNIFKFNFAGLSRDSFNDKLIRIQQFQTNFWHKQHHWYTNYEIGTFSTSIYTMPYARHEYILTSTKFRYNRSNEFDNVKKLTIRGRKIPYDSRCFFRNVKSLRLISGSIRDDELNQYRLSIEKIECLRININLSCIKKLIIENEYCMTSSLLLKILKTLPHISSLTITKDT